MITSVHNETIQNLSKLHMKKHRDQLSLTLVDGEHLIMEAYKAKVLTHVYGIKDQPLLHEVPYTQVSDNVMRKLCATTSLSHWVGVVKIIKDRSLTDHVLVLDGVQDPGNVGTLLRSASAFDFLSVILLPGCADPFSPKAIAASQGALFQCKIQTLSLEAFKTLLERSPHQLIVSDVHDAQRLEDLPSFHQCMLVLGSEGAGVSSSVQALADHKVRIHTHHVESLNVAMAGSILMHGLFSRKG
ncbi:MAG: RNA methyltransferase [Erysipelothrix sp.]|jgi:TrmH family RNA methyltransferase|nr:RNA methyltransferase [Erysipelothrix sp.]